MINENINIFDKYESEVRSYCRSFPVVFKKAKNSFLYDSDGKEYIDFLSCAGSLNYGHNNEHIKKAVLDYIQDDGLVMSLDLHSTVKESFISTFQENILLPRELEYKLQFTSPTGTSVVESAIKLARKFTGRENVVAFTNAFHGMSGTSLSMTGNKSNRQSISAANITRLPYDGYLGKNIDTLSLFRKMLLDNSSGLDLPAAVILETIQGEGGLNVASVEWLRNLRELTQEFGILLIVDDIQAGCGRSGNFFSFERAEIKPDMVCLSKSIGAMGFPFAVLLFSPHLDVWSVGEDNGTFRGNNLAFLAATIAIEHYWKNNDFQESIKEKEKIIFDFISMLKRQYRDHIVGIKGIGLMQGIEFFLEKDTAAIRKKCFEKNLVIECCGPNDQILKLMPALNIDISILQQGLFTIEQAILEHLDVYSETGIKDIA